MQKTRALFLGEAERLVRAERTDLERLNRQFQIINRAGGRREVPDVIHRLVEKEEFGDVLLDEFEVRVAGQMGNIVHRAGDKIVNADDLVAARQEQIGQVRTQKPGGAGDDGGGLLFFHSGQPGILLCARADEHGGDGADQDFQIEPQRPVVNVFEVKPHPVLEIGNLIAAADLPETGQPGLDAEAAAVGQIFKTLHFVHRQRARTDQAHFGAEHVVKLRQLVEAVFAGAICRWA